ncbi:alanine dehydrogenase [Flexithrix dorotheae]|uniref:alanine dehydrogenase n=1 Tax=Flexithrix dorotheae TaxID=70993 RepID=UPI000363960F|nr:alanine dehydrogenase [Flexithrix dorotheae]
MGKQRKEDVSGLAAELYQLHPQEVLERQKKKRGEKVTIGIPKEHHSEKRVTMRPEAVEILVNNGLDVCVESKAGEYSKHSDEEYSNAGAKIVYSSKEVFESDIILKIAPPTYEEIGYMKPGKTVISALQMSLLSKKYFQQLINKEITALAYDLLEDKVGGLPLVRAMSEIAGSTVMLIAAEYLSCLNNGKGIILGGITGVPPTKVVILGAGTVAEYAARTAIGLGAEVKIFDNHIYRLKRIKDQLNQPNLYTSAIDSSMLTDALMRADVAIGALRAEGGRAPVVVTEETVGQMKPNSVIIDVSIDRGGCFETSEVTDHKNPTFRKYDVIHYCVPNIASRVARTATTAISNIFTPMLIKLSELGGIDEMIFAHKWFANGVYTYRGGITNKNMANKYHLPYKNLDLIIAAKIG